LTALPLLAPLPTSFAFHQSLDCDGGSPHIGGGYLPQPCPEGLVSRRGGEDLFPSAQAKIDDEFLDSGLGLRDQFREVPSLPMTMYA
jgi:hypothetical protein